MHRLTASRIKLGRRCLWWARGDVEIPASDAGAAADLGTALHRVAEAEAGEDGEPDAERIDDAFRRLALGTSEDAALEGLPGVDRRELAALASAWREWWAGSGLVALDREVPVALSTVSGAGRVLHSQGPRDYSDAFAHEVPGTTDLHASAAGGHVVVDYKTGRGPHRLADHEDQLLHGSAAVYGGEGGRPEHLAIAVAWVTPDGVRFDVREVDAYELAIFVVELRRLLEAIPTAEPRPGLHCDDLYCPARAVCPATRAVLLAAEVPTEPRRRLPLLGPVTSDDEALALLHGLPLLEAWIAERGRAVKAYAAEHGGLRDPETGEVYRAREQRRETPRLDVAGAEEALVEAVGPEVAAAAIKRTTSVSWSGLKAGAKAAGVPQADAERRAREGLRKRGALKVSTYSVFGWEKET